MARRGALGSRSTGVGHGDLRPAVEEFGAVALAPVEVIDASFDFPPARPPSASLKAAVLSKLRPAAGETTGARRHGLHGVNMTVQAGEVVGVVGRNGAGKTTFLRLIAGILAPHAGRIITRGRVSPLIALGAGFHPELTAVENVRLYAAMIGLGELSDEDVAAIVDWAQVAEQQDEPLRSFSTGMLIRLGFSAATASRPDVLLLDEM